MSKPVPIESTTRPRDLRPDQTFGYCVYCNELVKRTPKAECPNGHPAEGVAGAITAEGFEVEPTLPKFNWSAFLMPPLWGAGHGAIIPGLIVLPLWLFMDQSIQSAVIRTDASTPLFTRIGVWVLAMVITVLTVGIMYWFGRMGWGLAWRRQYGNGDSSLPFDQFVKRQRRWMWVSAPLFIVLWGMGVYYWLYKLPIG